MGKPEANNLIVFFGGIGDILLWIPTLKAFEKKPDVICLYNTPALDILSQNNLVGKTFQLKSKWQLFVFALTHFKKYDTVYLNHLCGGDHLLRMMTYCSKNVMTNSPHYESQKALNKSVASENIHDSQQNYLLVFKKLPQFKAIDFNLDKIADSDIKLPENFIAIQLSAGNNKTPYKNWPVKHWSQFLKLVLEKYPDQKLVFLGHKDELELFDKLNLVNDNIFSLVGKTSVSQTFEIINKSSLFVGPDGGLMHVAIACNKPTFTIWGGSSPILYGYEQLLPGQHVVVKQNLTCMPCNAWINANKSKTADPLLCPDFVCLGSLGADEVFKQFELFYLRNKD